MKIIRNFVVDSDAIETEIITDDSVTILMERLRVVENNPKDLILRIPTRSEWLLFWGKGDENYARYRRYRARKKLKDYVSSVSNKKKA